LGLIIDRGRQQLVGGRELYVYQDSLLSDSVNRTSKAVQERLQLGTAELIRTGPSFQWITAETPVQAAGSNNCGAWMCCQFAAYLKAIVTNSQGPLSPDTREGRSSNTTITALTQLQQNERAREWGELARCLKAFGIAH
jgi:hypothetical protein